MYTNVHAPVIFTADLRSPESRRAAPCDDVGGRVVCHAPSSAAGAPGRTVADSRGGDLHSSESLCLRDLVPSECHHSGEATGEAVSWLASESS